MKALFVIDMQEVAVGLNHAKVFEYKNDELIATVNETILENEGNAVFYILNIMKDNFINKFAPVKAFDGTEEVQLVKGLNVVSDYIYKKYKGNALTNPELKKKLEELKIDEIEMVGLDGAGCVALTAMGAIKAGYKVTMNTKAIATVFPERAARFNNKLKKMGAEFVE